ncbi:MAG: adenylosuccinate lyase [Actinomycetota bacterium]|nr:adenylosuccinate lyase [Actinomycetota bacterium]
MIERYTLPEMKEIWSEEAKLHNWLQIEVLSCEAMVQLGIVPRAALDEIKRKARFDAERIREIEKRTRHDVTAFLENLAENIGESSRFIHLGLTSSDILDTGLAIQMRDAAGILIDSASRLLGIIKNKAFQYKDTIMIGRTHGVHAEPITFGTKLAVWAFETRRNLERLLDAQACVSCGKISGAVGTYGSVDPFVEKYVCEKLGLVPAEASSQILQRDRHAEYLCTLAIVASSLEKFATEIRALQRTEIMEAEEPFREGQTGSSAMPHKRNPIICERICGLSRVVRGNAMVALENMALWHERDISHSSAERVIIPDSTAALHYMTEKFIEVMEGMVVYPVRMGENIDITGGLIFSEKVLLGLVQNGATRQDAYKMVQRHALKAARGEESFRDGLMHDREVGNYLGPEQIEACFDAKKYISRSDIIFKRLEALRVKP